MFNRLIASSQTKAPRKETASLGVMTDVLIQPIGPGVVNAAPVTSQQPSLPILFTTISSWSEKPSRPDSVTSSGWVLSPTVPSMAKTPVSRAVGVTVEPVSVFENAWTETTSLEESIPIITPERTVTVRSEPPIEAVPEVVQIKYGLGQTPYQIHYEGVFTGDVERPEYVYAGALSKIESTVPAKVVLSMAKSQVTYVPESQIVATEDKYTDTITSISDRPKEVIISSSEATEIEKRPGGTITDFLIKPDRVDVERSAPPIPHQVEVLFAVTSSSERSERPTEVTSNIWRPEHAEIGTGTSESDIFTTVSSISKTPTSRIDVESIAVMTKSAPKCVHRGTETIKSEEPLIYAKKRVAEPVYSVQRHVRTAEVQAVGKPEPRRRALSHPSLPHYS